MARKRRKNQLVAGELNLTAMIDVAFQLLSFFVITIKPVDVMANLDVSRPAPNPPTVTVPKPPNIVTIRVFPGEHFVYMDNQVTREGLNKVLSEMKASNPTVLISCTPQSTHSKLVDVLDMCANAELTNLSVVSEP